MADANLVVSNIVGDSGRCKRAIRMILIEMFTGPRLKTMARIEVSDIVKVHRMGIGQALVTIRLTHSPDHSIDFVRGTQRPFVQKFNSWLRGSSLRSS